MKPLDQYNTSDAGATASPLTNADVASAGMTDQERAVFRRMQAQLEIMERELSRAKNRIRELDTKLELTTQRLGR
jgi:hypothetical protein